LLEFERRQQVSIGDFKTWIVSRERLILSELSGLVVSPSNLKTIARVCGRWQRNTVIAWRCEHASPASALVLESRCGFHRRVDGAETPPVPSAPARPLHLLVELDGAGKTTFARNLCATIAKGTTVRRVRYFHWILSLRRHFFPWPSLVETPRKPPASGIIHGVLSAARLFKNLIHTRLVYHLGIRRWVKHGDCVIVDRFIFYYWLDPVSLRYHGPTWLLALAVRAMPKLDIVFSLEADADTLLSRKQELTRDEIARQSKNLAALPLYASRKVVLNAGLNPQAIVSKSMKVLRLI
jgi:hypothetical protein